MAYTYKQLKQAAEKIGAAYGLGLADYAKINGYLAANNPDAIKNILAGDLSAVPGAAAAVGVSLCVHTPQKESGPEKSTAGGRSSVRKKKKTENNGARDILTGSPVECEIVNTPAGVLPDNVPGLVMDAINSYCEQNNISDLSKERQPRWGAACYIVGVSVFKNSKILHDAEKERINGGTVYDVGRVAALCDLWGVLCQNFCKAPLIDDFARFAGVSDSWLYGAGSQDRLTPARALLLQKLKRLQESGLSALIVDGRQNPTGALAALNHWHGWTQTREIIHTDGSGAASVEKYPDFKLLENNSSGGGDI